MTKPTPEAVAFRAKIDAEGPDWPKELKDAATLLRCELDVIVYKHWRETGGPAQAGSAYSVLYFLLSVLFSASLLIKQLSGLSALFGWAVSSTCARRCSA